MAEIRDHVRATLGETYTKLQSVANYDGQTKPDVAGLKILSALARYQITDEDSLNEFGREYLGNVVVRAMIPLAIDYYMVQTRLVDNASRPAGWQPSGGEVGTNYNRIEALKVIDEQLAQRIAEDAPLFTSLVQPATHGIRVTPHTKSLRTQDPYDAFDKIDCGTYGYEIGNCYVVLHG